MKDSNLKTTIGKNVFANAAGKIWTAVSSLIFVPFFIKIMGEEAYGIVTFFAVMQSVLNILGVGLQRTLRREFAEDGEKSIINTKKYKLLRSTEFVYFIVCLIITFLCGFGAKFISNKWLNYDTLNPDMVSHSIVLMGVSIGLQLIANLYAGGIYGLDKQVLANVLQIGWMTLKNVGVIPVLLVFNGSVLSFYIWMVVADIIYCCVLRIMLIRGISEKILKVWTLRDLSVLKNIWKYAGGLFLISLGTALSTQLDKIIMSKNLSVVECGAYNSSFQLGSFTSYVPTIIGTAIFSNIATLIFQEKKKEAENLFIPMNRIAVIVVSAMAAYIAVFSYDIMMVWTGSEIYADIIKQAAPLVIIGYMLNAYQQVPYDYLLASGNTKLNQGLLAVSIPYVATITVYLTRHYGVLGASCAWFFQLLILTTLYLLIFYKVSFGKSGIKWLLKDVYGIFLCALIPAVIIKQLVRIIGTRPLITVIIAVMAGGVTLMIMFIVFERERVLSFVKRRKR